MKYCKECNAVYEVESLIVRGYCGDCAKIVIEEWESYQHETEDKGDVDIPENAPILYSESQLKECSKCGCTFEGYELETVCDVCTGHWTPCEETGGCHNCGSCKGEGY